MELLKLERVMLINQYKILIKLYPEETSFYTRHIKALEEGYTIHYKDMVDWLEDGMSEDECQEVVDILSLYRAINFSFIKLENKTGIEASDIRFPGFDGNIEAKQLGYVNYCLHDLDMFPELRRNGPYPDYNNHMPMLWKYKKMLQVWNASGKKQNLTRDEIIEVITAKNKDLPAMRLLK